MNDTESRPNRLDELAHDFAERLRRGEHPSLSEYAARHPELADEIRDLFPALAMIERFGSVSGPLAGGQASAATADGTPLQRLGEYRILREVARGGMGIVYEAVQESLGRHVALKVLPFQSLADATQRERFRREARAAANLHHTNIVPVYGIGEHDGIQYFAMQFIQGQTLDSVLREIVRMRTSRNGDSNGLAGASPAPNAGLAEGLLTGRFSGAQHGETDGVPPAPTAGTTTRDNTIGESTSEVIADHSGLSARRGGAYFRSVIRVGIQVAEALAYAHQNGIVHRDIKPANLLLDSRGTVWITDFGLAKSVGADDLTSPGDFMGTLRYMAPEQFRGAVGPSVDVYSLGLTLYELATLQPAFTANGRAEMYNQLLHKDPRQPRKIDPRIPQDLETLILKAIAKEPQHRYTSAAALAEDLRRILADRPIQARRSRWPERFVRWCRRNPAVATLTAVAAMLLVAIAAVALSDAARLRIEQAATQTHLAQAQRAESEATHRLYRSLVAQARAVRLSRRLGQRFKALEILTEATAAARLMDLSPDDVLELRNESIAALALPDLRIDKAWEIPRDYFMTLEFDPSFQRYACVDMQGVVRIHRVSDASEIVHFTGFDSTDHRLGMTAPMTFSPDGQFLVLSHNGRLRTWRLTEQEPVAVLDVRTDAGAFTVSPDSRQLVIGRANGAIDLFDLHSGQNVRHLEGGPTARDIAIHPSGGRLAVSCSTGVQIHDIKTNDLVATFPLPNGGGQIEWNPDGQTLAVCDDDNEVIHIWDAAAQITVVRLEGHRGRIRFAYSTAGDQIASYCWDGVLRLWDAKSGRLQLSTLMSMSCLRFSPDDRRLAASFDGTQLQVWDVATATAYRTLVRTPVRAGRQYRTCAIGPKDGLLALAMSDGVGFWNLATGASLGFAALGEQRFISIEPSGDLLISTSGNLQRVPLRREPAMTTAIQVGPPEKVPLPAESGHFAIDRTGRVLATAEYWGALVSRQDRPGPPIRLAPHEDTRSVAVSPDGRQVATGSFWRDKVKLWDSQTGTLERVLPVPSGSSVCYSPDGRWLATTGGGCRLWSVGTWEPGPNLGVAGPVAFSSDGSLFAMDTGAGVIKLFDPASGRECARLEDPSLDRSTDVAFSPDGGQLISATNDSCAIHIWNLKAIREKLAQRQLDWNPSP